VHEIFRHNGRGCWSGLATAPDAGVNQPDDPRRQRGRKITPHRNWSRLSLQEQISAIIAADP
jgi:hypothetical protein